MVFAIYSIDNSGVNGTWIRGQTNKINNNYYKVLLKKGWQQS
jgi:hypothetical protein